MRKLILAILGLQMSFAAFGGDCSWEYWMASKKRHSRNNAIGIAGFVATFLATVPIWNRFGSGVGYIYLHTVPPGTVAFLKYYEDSESVDNHSYYPNRFGKTYRFYLDMKARQEGRDGRKIAYKYIPRLIKKAVRSIRIDGNRIKDQQVKDIAYNHGVNAFMDAFQEGKLCKTWEKTKRNGKKKYLTSVFNRRQLIKFFKKEISKRMQEVSASQ